MVFQSSATVSRYRTLRVYINSSTLNSVVYNLPKNEHVSSWDTAKHDAKGGSFAIPDMPLGHNAQEAAIPFGNTPVLEMDTYHSTWQNTNLIPKSQA